MSFRLIVILSTNIPYIGLRFDAKCCDLMLNVDQYTPILVDRLSLIERHLMMIGHSFALFIAHHIHDINSSVVSAVLWSKKALCLCPSCGWQPCHQRIVGSRRCRSFPAYALCAYSSGIPPRHSEWGNAVPLSHGFSVFLADRLQHGIVEEIVAPFGKRSPRTRGRYDISPYTCARSHAGKRMRLSSVHHRFYFAEMIEVLSWVRDKTWCWWQWILPSCFFQSSLHHNSLPKDEAGIRSM